MSDVDISEELPNGDDSAFEDQQQTADDDQASSPPQSGSPNSAITSEHGTVYVATSQGLLAPEQYRADPCKTTHIVIHDQGVTLESPLKTPTDPLPPPTPATPLSRERGLKYQWDDSATLDILPVRCKHTNGELHKAKFGSGGRGRCILTGDDDKWVTPNEFENTSGRASSKDWKRSIRYGGRTLQCLIEDGLLHPHATSCTCAACCDDESVTGPVRLFVPYKRKKKDSESGEPLTPVMKKRILSTKSGTPVTLISSPNKKDSSTNSSNNALRLTSAMNGETVQILTTDPQGNLVAGDAVMMTSIPMSNLNTKATVTMDVTEQKHWWHLEEMANSLLQQAQQLKMMIEQAKAQSLSAKESAIQAVKQQMEKSITNAKIEAQIQLQRAMMEERSQKDIAIQHAVAQVRADMGEKGETLTVVYDSSWTSAQAGQNNITGIMVEEVEEEEEEKEKN